MRRALLIFVLCLIWTDLACSRRTARAVQLPSVNNVARNQQGPRGSSNEMRDVIESLKKKLQGSQASDESAKESAGGVSSSGDASNPATGVGTSGALSVETRYPAPPNSAASAAPPRGHALSRAGDAIRRAADGASLWVIGLCALAAALIVALLMRRSQHSA